MTTVTFFTTIFYSIFYFPLFIIFNFSLITSIHLSFIFIPSFLPSHFTLTFIHFTPFIFYIFTSIYIFLKFIFQIFRVSFYFIHYFLLFRVKTSTLFTLPSLFSHSYYSHFIIHYSHSLFINSFFFRNIYSFYSFPI